MTKAVQSAINNQQYQLALLYLIVSSAVISFSANNSMRTILEPYLFYQHGLISLAIFAITPVVVIALLSLLRYLKK